MVQAREDAEKFQISNGLLWPALPSKFSSSIEAMKFTVEQLHEPNDRIIYLDAGHHDIRSYYFAGCEKSF